MSQQHKIIMITLCLIVTCIMIMYVTQTSDKIMQMQQVLQQQQQTITYQNDVIVKLGEHVKFLANEHTK